MHSDSSYAEIALEEFREYAKVHNVIPVWTHFLADSETPLALYRKLTGEREGTFLLESAEHGGAWSRYSFIGVNSAATLTERDGVAVWEGRAPAGAPSGCAPLAALRKTIEHLSTPKIEGLPPLTGGLVGYMSYDIVRALERIPSLSVKDLDIPVIAYLLALDIAIFDHFTGSLTLIANAINWDGSADRVDEAYADACARLNKMVADVRLPSESALAVSVDRAAPDFTRDMQSAEYQAKVDVLKEEIRKGEAFQIVLSQRFKTELKATPLDVYRVLRLHNPSPYMYIFNFADDLHIVGSSPEALIKVSDGEAMIHPIAGTRPRSHNPEVDQASADELLADPKERAEHLMLVDLGRNDLGRVCKAGSVEVVEFMHIERYSHVMHIVSTVTGEVRPELHALDALLAVFPAGTLSGAPKPRAMEIIEQQEPTRRGIYGGTIGYFDFLGNVDSCITIRTAVIKGTDAYVQAGAGIVADSRPELEDAECTNKAAAVLSAIATANSMKHVEQM